MSIFNSFGDRGVAFGKNLYPAATIGTTIFPDTFAINFINIAGLTDQTQINAIIRLVYFLKAYNLWDKLNAIYPFVGGTASSHKWNLKDPQDTDAAFRLSFIGGVTHASTGVTFNGTTGYADTFLTASSVLANNNNSLAYYSRTAAASSGQFAVDAGVTSNVNTAANGMILAIRRFGNNSLFSTGNNTASASALTTTTDARGLFFGTTTSATSRKHYQNGTVIATDTTNQSQVLTSIKVFIGAISQNNVATFFSGSRECAFASIGSGLTDLEALNLQIAVQDFQTTLGRQV